MTAISYCIAVYRPAYARLLVADLAAKTSARYEILLWLNVSDAELEAALAAESARGVPLRVLGRTPENIGMKAYRALFAAARGTLIVQIDDDVVRVSHGIAERAARLFARHPRVRQLVADVWQDEHTTGARPPLEHYRVFDAADGLYAGPVDGWFAVYHASLRPLLASLRFAPYVALGSQVQARLASQGLAGVLDRGMRVFHVIGPAYAEAFGMLAFEIAKYRRLGRADIVDWYEGWRDGAQATRPGPDELECVYRAIDARHPGSSA